MSAFSSNFSAAAISASVACCGVSKFLMPAVEAAIAAGASFTEDCCAAKRTHTHRHVPATAPTIQGSLERLPFANLDFIGAPLISFPRFPAAYLRRPPPPRLKPPPPPRELMLEAPRLLPARAF